MGSRTFFGGIRAPHRKSLSKGQAIEVMAEMDSYFVPVSQHIGGTPTISVAVGDTVLAGSLLAKKSGFVSANIFSPVSGKVKEIKSMRGIAGQMCVHIVIENDRLNERIMLEKLQNPTREQIAQRASDAGIVGMGGAAFPTPVKLSVPEGKKCDVLIINAAECEPYITCDYRIMLEYTEEFLKGASYLKTAVGADHIVIGIENNKMDAVEKLQGKAGIEVVVLKAKYPQGAEKQLIYAATRRKVPNGGLPIDCGAVVQNVHTAFSLCRAIDDGLPCYERVLTVSGKGINQPKNLWVKTGTKISDIVEYCGGIKEDIVKVLNGGPMMGVAQSNLDATTTKASSALLFLQEEELDLMSGSTCINCARCASVCPMRLMPMFIDSNTLVGDFAAAKQFNAISCIECGCCSYVCPAKRPLVQSLRLAKKLIKERNI